MKTNTSTEFTAIEICLDAKMTNGASDHFGAPARAFWSNDLGAGVFITANGVSGVYGNDDLRRKVLSVYWDKHEAQITEALMSTDDFDEACRIVCKIIASCIAEILECEC